MNRVKKMLYSMVFCSFFMSTTSQNQETIEIIRQDKEAMQATFIMINSILKNIQQLFIIIQSAPEMPKKIEQWGRSKIITHWPNKASWNSFSKDLQRFIKELVIAKEKEIQTEEYKYLAHILENENISNKLIKLQNDLTQFVPTIIIPEFGQEKMDPKSKKALLNAINALVTILYADSIFSQFDEIFKTYEPVAEKLKEEARVAQERALDEKDKNYQYYD